MEDLYYYAEIKKRNGSKFIGLNGVLISGVAICSARLDLTDYGSQINPLLSLQALNGLEYYNVDFKFFSQIESLGNDIFSQTISNSSVIDAEVSSVLTIGNRNFRDWMAAINELNGADVFGNCSFDVYLCSGKFCGAVYVGANIWRTPDYNHTVTLTEAEFPYYRETSDSSLKIMKGVLKTYQEKKYRISLEVESWDSELNKPLQSKKSNNTSRSAIKCDPIIFGFAYPGFDGDQCACFPTNQSNALKSGGTYSTSALPLYQPDTKNICIFDKDSGYCGINFDSVKIDSTTNKITIGGSSVANTTVARTAQQSWNLTEEERTALESEMNPTGTWPVPFYEFNSFVNGEEIKIHTAQSLMPTPIVYNAGTGKYQPQYGGRIGGIVSRGLGGEKKVHSAGENYSSSDVDTGLYLNVVYLLPAASMDDKSDISGAMYASNGKGDKGDLWKFYKQNKFLTLNSNLSDDKILEFGTQIYSTSGTAGIFGTAENHHFVFLRPELIGNNENDLIINVMATIDYETTSCGQTGVAATETMDQRSYLYFGVNKSGDTAEDAIKSPVWDMTKFQTLTGLGVQIPTAQMATLWGFKQLDGQTETSYGWQQVLLNPYSSEASYDLNKRQTVLVNFDSSHLDSLTIDSISTAGYNDDGNWFLHYMILRSRWDNGIAYHSTVKIHKHRFQVYVRKYLEDLKIYSTGYGAKSGIDGSLVYTSNDATREILSNFAEAGGLLVNFTNERTLQTITGWAKEDDTVLSVISDLNKSTLNGVVLGADGICYDFDPITGDSVKTIGIDDVVAVNGDAVISYGITSADSLKTGVRVNFREFPDESGFSSSIYIDNEKVIDFAGESTRYEDLFYLDVDYWSLFSWDGLKACCDAFQAVKDNLKTDDILEFDARWVRDRSTAEIIALHLCLAYTRQRQIVTFEGVLERFKDVKIGQFVTWNMWGTILEDSRHDTKKFIVKKRTLNADRYTYTIVLEEALIQ